MRLVDVHVDVLNGAYSTAVGDKILADRFTSGVNTLTYAAASQIDPGTGTTLILGSGYQPFIAYVPEPAAFVQLAVLWVASSRRCRRVSLLHPRSVSGRSSA
jgi:hypothetical protein